ncbi:MAG: hypothetical protein MUO77_05285, partial [Anaerolineales bacterium]|nr:hypothetical protein [Anaerolineales bacterium]
MMTNTQNTNIQNTNLGYGDIMRFSQLILERFGLVFSDARHTEMEYGIKRAFAASTCRNMDEYYNLLLDTVNGAVELERLVNSLTVNETHFFRDAAQLDALQDRVLPEMIERKRFIRTLRIWSAGCSTGEEPYSIAMLLRNLLPDVDDWSITILGTDINSKALDKAKLGLFADSAFREERAKKWQSRFFVQKENRYELLPEVRRMVSFRQLNLADSNYPAYETNT